MYETAVPGIVAGAEAALAETDESVIHRFLLEYPDLLRSFLRYTHILSKYRLADAFIPDFTLVGYQPMTQRPDPVVLFVEIERANIPLFTKSGDPTSHLTHAVRQVQDWKRWIRDNRSYVSTDLSRTLSTDTAGIIKPAREWPSQLAPRLAEGITQFGFSDVYVVVIGRRQTLTLSDRVRLSQMTDDYKDIRIVTYDALLDELLAQLRRSDTVWGRQHWYDPE